MSAARSSQDTERALKAVNYAEPARFDADSYGVLLYRAQINVGSSLLIKTNVTTQAEPGGSGKRGRWVK